MNDCEVGVLEIWIISYVVTVMGLNLKEYVLF